MTPEHFQQITDLLTDPIILVSTTGSIQAVNRRASDCFGWSEKLLPDLTLGDVVDLDSKVLGDYLRSCARSRDPVMTSLVISNGEAATNKFRCRGALLEPRTKTTPASVMLMLESLEASNEPFVVLNEKLKELAHEIRRRKKFEREIRQHLQLSKFGREFGLTLTRTGTMDEMLSRCTDLMVKHLDAAFARIWVLDEDGATLVLRASSGLYTHLDGEHSRVRVGQLKIGHIAHSQQPHLTNEVIGDVRVNHQSWARQEGMVAFAGYPLIVDGATNGVMAIFAKRPLEETVIEAMSLVANDLAVGISRKRTENRLQKKAAQLELADARKNEFLAMLAHELRNPLAPVRSGLDLLESDHPDSELIPVMQHHIEQIVRMVDDLLDVSRIMRGRIEMRKEPICVKQIVDHSISSVRLAVEAAGHDLCVDAIDDSLWVHGDKVRLTQAVTNLLQNAVKYTPKGGRIELNAERLDGLLKLRIRDNGMGIDPEFVPELFTLFAQATRSLDRSQGGIGIGLALVKKIMLLHGGEVTASSAGPGKGSEFTIRIPLSDPPAIGKTEKQRDDNQTVPCYRVMIVDDNQASARILALLLQKNWNHEIAVEYDGSRAIALATTDPPDVIFLDIGLPGMNGYEVAQTLRQNAELERTFICALTGYGTDEDRRKSAQAGINVHLVKPIGLDDLKLVFQMCAEARALAPATRRSEET